MPNQGVLLISLHNKKALGVGYLEKSLKNAGIDAHVLYFKGFNSVNPSSASQKELELLVELINKIKPRLIGLSVMSSLYMETVWAVNKVIKDKFDIPVLWGGVYPTLFPEKSMDYADYVIKGEGEDSIVSLYNALKSQTPLEEVPNLTYKKDGELLQNPMAPLVEDLDSLGYPEIGGDNKYFINEDQIHYQDPALSSISFELAASRGCPFACSYCCSSNLKKNYRGKGHYIRFRSVKSVMAELNEAKKKLKNLKVIRFWDEIFSDEDEWVDEFVARYRKEIAIPFEIWAHPLKVNENLINKLVSAGLFKVVMGIQSGSPRVRKEVFRRVEKQEDILNATEIFRKARVPHKIYDLILRHGFETEEDIKESYNLTKVMKIPFDLQLHEMQYFPGIDIVDMAVNAGLYKKEDMEKVMYAPMKEQYGSYWGKNNKNPMMNFWYSLIFMNQFRTGRIFAKFFEKRSNSQSMIKIAPNIYKVYKKAYQLRHYRKKAQLLLKSYLMKA